MTAAVEYITPMHPGKLEHTTAIPQAEIWAPSPTIFNIIPLPPHDTLEMRKILASAQRRRETAAMRNLWKQSRSAAPSLSRSMPAYIPTAVSSQKSRWPAPVKDIRKSMSRQTSCSREDRTPADIMHMRHSQIGGELEHIGQPAGMVAYRQHMKPAKCGLPAEGDKRVNLPTIHINSPSVDWMGEIKKACEPRPRYSTPTTVIVDKSKIKRELLAKKQIVKKTQSFFKKTSPFFKETYTINPEWESEYYQFVNVPTPPDTPLPPGNLNGDEVIGADGKRRPFSVPNTIYSRLGRIGKRSAMNSQRKQRLAKEEETAGEKEEQEVAAFSRASAAGGKMRSNPAPSAALVRRTSAVAAN